MYTKDEASSDIISKLYLAVYLHKKGEKTIQPTHILEIYMDGKTRSLAEYTQIKLPKDFPAKSRGNIFSIENSKDIKDEDIELL